MCQQVSSNKVVRVGVVGATGQTGALFCKSAVDEGHQVSIMVRNPDKVPEILGQETASKLRIVIAGDSRNAEDMSKLAADVDVIICVVGTPPQQPKEKCIMLKTAEALLAATDARHKIFFCSSLGMNGSSSIIYGLLAMIAGRPNVHDCDAADKLLMNSIGKGGASVTVMRPAALGDGQTGGYLASAEGSAAVGVLGRADLSQFMLNNLESKNWENKAVHLYAMSGLSCY
eukprot:gnl/MRDRNA2_/MRDRNA2_89776_c0_seq1.p1 gnl/MRDRNA2_/MRDRNA2_89776_c0~~gnl/MRDRNA2_/MRDRNA2_89776_c0_seq1.p1  ORF type:complete len:230 (+),score=47.27 gnl/MRDRNA2_/MRDRNA2_89776_c0_seq1:85-774(+)